MVKAAHRRENLDISLKAHLADVLGAWQPEWVINPPVSLPDHRSSEIHKFCFPEPVLKLFGQPFVNPTYIYLMLRVFRAETAVSHNIKRAYWHCTYKLMKLELFDLLRCHYQ